MTPSRGLLSSAANGARLQIKSEGPRIGITQRQFSSRPSPTLRLAAVAKPAINSSSLRPRLPASIRPSNASRAISLWPFGSGASTSNTDTFGTLHKPSSAQASDSSATTSAVPTAPAAPTATASVDSAAPTATDSTPLDIKLLNIDDITPIVPDVHTLPEKIGHFHELGLNFGYGPSSMIEWLLEHVHIYSGTPWWGSILITAAIIRTAFIPMIIKQSDQMARLAPLKDELDKIRANKVKALRDGDAKLQLEADLAQKHLTRTAGLNMKWTFIPILVQLPIGFATFRFMRAAAEVPVPGWETGGFGWITDLTQTDPLMITPVFFFGLMHMMGRLGGESGMAQPPPYMRGFMLWGIPGLIFATMLWMPVALQLSFITSTVFGIASSFALRKPAIREYLGMVPMYKKPQTDDFANNPSGLNMTPSYQAPRRQAQPVTIDVQKKNFVGQKMDDFRSGMNQASQDLKKKFGTSEQEDKSGRGKTFLQQAKAYEDRKRKELDYERRNR